MTYSQYMSYLNNTQLFVEIESDRVKFWNPKNSLHEWELGVIKESLDDIIERESKFDPLKEIKEKYNHL